MIMFFSALVCIPLSSLSPVLKTLLFPADLSSTFLVIYLVLDIIQDYFLNAVIERKIKMNLLSAFSGGATLRTRIVEVVCASSTPFIIYKGDFFLQYMEAGNFAEGR